MLAQMRGQYLQQMTQKNDFRQQMMDMLDIT